MLRWFVVLACCGFLLAGAQVARAQSGVQAQMPGIEHFRKGKPAVVRVRSVFRLKDRPDVRYGMFGTGFLVSRQGHIVTADHNLNYGDKLVPEGGYELDRVEVSFPGGHVDHAPAYSVRRRPGPQLTRDVALLQLRTVPNEEPLPVRNSRDMGVGWGVIGIVPNRNGVLEPLSGFLHNTNDDGLFRVPDHIVGGASGSPLMNLCGEVVAMIILGSREGTSPDALATPTVEIWDMVAQFATEYPAKACGQKPPVPVCDENLLRQALTEVPCHLGRDSQVACQINWNTYVFRYRDVWAGKNHMQQVQFECNLGHCITEHFGTGPGSQTGTGPNIIMDTQGVRENAMNVLRACMPKK